jgi:DNA repair protein RadC
MNTIAEIKLSYSNTTKNNEIISTSEKAYQIFNKIWDQGLIQLQEEFKMLLLDRNNQLLGFYSLSKGGISGTVVDLKILFAVALKSKSSAIIIAHNHPSGNLKASNEDIELNKKIKSASKFLDILFLDHLIISNDGFSSFCDKGLMWEK